MSAHDKDSSKWPTADTDGSGLFHGQPVYKDPPKPELTFGEEVLRAKLTPEQYLVTQEGGTERRWKGEYLSVTEDGTFSCVVCGAPLFKTVKKYDSGCGWLSFSDVVNESSVVRIRDESLADQGRVRMEVACGKCGAHLGHVFEDGPKRDTGLRYCINSLSLDFQGDEEKAEN